jgi:hypothetical protein
MTASDLYALSQGVSNQGNSECHWCGSKCEQKWVHDDPPAIVGTRSTSYARRPANAYICQGCWLFRRTRITIPFINGDYQDGKAPKNFSWWITDTDAKAIPPIECPKLYDQLLKPPLRFVLALLIPDPAISGFLKVPHSIGNVIQLCEVNNLKEIKAETPLKFTVNNIVHSYSIYELEEAIRNTEENGYAPGVRALIHLLGRPKIKVKDVGRPKLEETHEARKNKTITTGKK